MTRFFWLVFSSKDDKLNIFSIALKLKVVFFLVIHERLKIRAFVEAT